MKVLNQLDSLDNIKDGETRKLITKTTSSGSGNAVSAVSVSGDTITYTKGVTALTAHQNTFSKVKVGSTNIEADSAGDTLELVAGTNVTLTPDATNDKVTIAATDTNTTYTLSADTTNNQIKLTPSSGSAQSVTVPFATDSSTANTLKSYTYSRGANTNTWFKVATGTMSGSYGEKHAYLFIKGNHNSNYKQNGIIALDAVGGSTAGVVSSYAAQFMSATEDLNLENFYIEYKNGDATTGGIVNFWIRANTNSYAGWVVKILSNSGWTIASSSPTATSLPSESFTGKNAERVGYVKKAIADKNGDDITTTYYKASNPSGYTSNTGTITKVQANGTDVASSGTANIPAASTSAYGVTKLSNATDSSSEVLAATPKAVKAAYDLAAGKGAGTITGVSVNGTSVATSGVANITSVPASILSGAIPSAVTATTQSASDDSTKIATTAFVKTAIDNLPEPMVFKGSLGTGGTITALPVDGTATVGDTYKVITAGTYASKAAKVGDTFICLTKTSSENTWELIPSGDEPSGTVTSITIKGSSPITVDSESAITTSGTRTISHANSGVTAGTYRSVTVNATGHVTAGTNPTTLSGYGITDAKIENGVITLGSNTITPVTDISGKVSKSGDTMSGNLTIQKASPKLVLKASDTSDVAINIGNSNYTRDAIVASNVSVNGYNLVIDSGGRTILGSGEAGANLHSTLGKNVDTETLYLISDNQIWFDSNAQTIGNRVGFQLDNSGNIVPTVADTATTNKGGVGTSTYKWANGYFTNINGVAVGDSPKFTDNDTKNTAGSTDTSSKIYLIGATSQAANPQTYSDNEVFTTSGVLQAKSYSVNGGATIEFNSTNKCIEFNFV